ncbi:hypothetical protein SAURM35S_05504 [Streptomyces aurantiogriseus]|uniref:DUF1876 domain-containing protein n=2 Tax=Streptomyces aurantiogriseus TaxID=66870 RepID=A0A918FM97_9ACTN|nr:hypothetical protein GCM10010251_84920 [Streptomyces aurantiogriseus]
MERDPSALDLLGEEAHAEEWAGKASCLRRPVPKPRLPLRTEVITMESKQWTVQIFITEDGDDTHARAVLTTGETSTVTGQGTARRNPVDRPIPEIGDELAASRALDDLAVRLHDVASDDIVHLAGPVEA